MSFDRLVEECATDCQIFSRKIRGEALAAARACQSHLGVANWSRNRAAVWGTRGKGVLSAHPVGPESHGDPIGKIDRTVSEQELLA